MARILSIDYGRKRCGIAATDPLQIIVTAIDTIATHNLFDYLVQYMSDEEVEKIVFGKP
ncbi:Holliday junction resolvase RuvX, partial [Saprospiraceae bacterium]|nr:Holliday junction resolvase RuvX [Saprospiraceae bacterium]